MMVDNRIIHKYNLEKHTMNIHLKKLLIYLFEGYVSWKM